MFAIRQYEFGPASVLRHEEVPDPEPARGQVRVTVAACGVHLVDTTIRQGGFGPVEFPMTPGREVAGVVTALGPGTGPEWLGRRVVAHLGQANGGYAELAVVNAASLHALPDDVSFEQAVAMIGTGRTVVAVLDRANLTGDDVVLVTSAAGGMGTLFVQEARNVGAQVVGLASGSKLDHVVDNGADGAIDYTRPGWADGLHDFTVVLDGVGGEAGAQALTTLGVGGRQIIYGWASGTMTPISTEALFAKSLTATVALGPGMMRRGLRELEEESLAGLASGRFRPLVNPPFALRDAARAHEALETRAVVGKVVLKP
ncbi:NADPH2:quinone reductase [Lentzea fradiae]|uniref:NADPH2:quinone reductase n=1 Tax=Lentzea fradiae TaxID=200378 RepID=A0A1G7UC46_9PSEU|nr:zinc-binding dehydrogenase [Lentzea fradiae]SDG44330.1 NADPH2:quinone reductase [Lentzea fradiae]